MRKGSFFWVMIFSTTVRVKYSLVGVNKRFSRMLYNSSGTTQCCLLTVGQSKTCDRENNRFLNHDFSYFCESET